MTPETLDHYERQSGTSDDPGRDQGNGREILTGSDLDNFIQLICEEIRKENENKQCSTKQET